MAPNKKVVNRNVASKKCPECMTYIANDATECFSCGARVKDADKLGIAKRPFNWKAYLFSILTATAFAWYMWWAFFKE